MSLREFVTASSLLSPEMMISSCVSGKRLRLTVTAARIKRQFRPRRLDLVCRRSRTISMAMPVVGVEEVGCPRSAGNDWCSPVSKR